MSKGKHKIKAKEKTKTIIVKTKNFLKKNTKLSALLAGLILLPILFLVVILMPFRNKVFANTFIAGVYVGDTTESEAVEILKREISLPEKITLRSVDQEFEISTSEIELSYDFEKSAKRAYNFPNRINLLFNHVNLGLFVNVDENKLDEILTVISSKVETIPVYPTVSEKESLIIVEKGKNGKVVNLASTKQIVLENISLNKDPSVELIFENTDIELSQEEALNIQNRAGNLIEKKINFSYEYYQNTAYKNTILSFLNYGNSYDEKEINKLIVEISKSLNRGPQNSIFLVNDGKVEEFTPSVDGVTVDEDKLKEEILKSLHTLETTEEKTINLQIPVILNPAKIKNKDVNDLGINELIGRGVSYFRGSIPNRVYNLDHAAKKFRGILVAPDDTFSFNEILGDVSALTGYKSAYVIKDGKTVLGDGGGVCQVSTTLFRSILDTGLPIVERRAHSYRVGYYEQGFPVGLDATIYHPTTDLKFKNNTEKHILIQSSIDIPRSTLVFEIYGTDDGRIATTTKPIITSSTAPQPDLYIDDPTLPTGQTKQTEYKAWGARVVFDYKVTKNGETLTEKTFVSNYQPWQAVFLRGTGPVD